MAITKTVTGSSERGDLATIEFDTDEDKVEWLESSKQFGRLSPEEQERIMNLSLRKLKMRGSRIYWPPNDDNRKKISNSMQGKNKGEENPMYGKQGWCKGLTKETDPRIRLMAWYKHIMYKYFPSEAVLTTRFQEGHEHSEESKQKMSDSRYKYLDEHPEFGEWMSNLRKQFYKDDPVALQKLLKCGRKVREDPICKQKMIRSLKEYWSNPKRREEMSNIKLKYYEENPWVSEIMSYLTKEAFKNPDTVEKSSESHKKFYQENPEKHPNSILAELGALPEPQIDLFNRIADIFSNEDIQMNFHVIVDDGSRFIDVALPKFKLGFEYDGQYFHNLPGRPEDDAIRSKQLKAQGWAMVHFDEEGCTKVLV